MPSEKSRVSPGRFTVRSFFRQLLWSRLGLTGLAIALVSGALFLLFLVVDLLGFQTGPYSGILGLLILPGFFVLGLLLMPIGYLRANRRWLATARGETPGGVYPVRDLNHPRIRRNVLVFLILTLCNLLILGVASYRGVEFMESTSFCGLACHRVMGPEFAAYQISPHSRVDCVRCHVGPGVPGFVRSKVSGVRQLASIALGRYPRPIPTPVENLRPARETCEACHWPKKYHGDRLRILTRYDEDEGSTELKTVLLLHVGGGNEPFGSGSGIHWHMNLANEITYLATDRERLKIPWVRLRDRQGRVTEFLASEAGLTPEAVEKAPKRRMDCIDCHNRPAHLFKLPEDAADEAIRLQGLDRRLPFLKQRMVLALKQAYATTAEARRGIERSMDRYYRENHPGVHAKLRDSLLAAVRATQEAYARNVFPEMGVSGSVHPDHLGHERFPGCFRCHDSDHRSADGREIRQDCDRCHTLLAVQETDPPILKQLQGLL